MSKTVKKLRHNEYYGFTKIQDNLYKRSLNNENFKNLFNLVTSEENIMLAYRNIKSNNGSETSGVDNKDINYLKSMKKEDFVNKMQRKMQNYHPGKVKRVYIDKPNGDKRPLGIPTIEDRVIQQCLKQVLEPICEAKFYEHSYGFRPNRSTHHALSRSVSLININKLYYTVDIDIKGFFDNVNHSKLLKQMWSLGIKDKKVLKIISNMLKAEVVGEGISNKGVPQGGVLSPLLSNTVLNELDWWIASQFQRFPTKTSYADDRKKFRALKNTKLKEVFIVRYADDFKLFCRNYEDARRLKIAVENWLKDRLSLDISKEKSRITNLRRSSTEFLGFKIKAVSKKTTRGEYVAWTSMKEDRKKSIVNELKKSIYAIKRQRLRQGFKFKKEILNYNSKILGLQNYFKYATDVYQDFADIKYKLDLYWYHTLRKRNLIAREGIGKDSGTVNKIYPDYDGKLYNINGITLYPLTGVKHKNPMNFSQKTCSYTEEGREEIHKKLTFDITEFATTVLKSNIDENMELVDSRISLYAQQKGKCPISGVRIYAKNCALHHKIPREYKGTDEYKNLMLVIKEIHILIHATKEETINKYLNLLNLSKVQIKKLNKYREIAKCEPINI